MSHDWVPSRRLLLGDAINHLLDRGVVVEGKAVISLGEVDLVYLGVQLVLSSVETLQRGEPGPGAVQPRLPSAAPQGGGAWPGTGQERPSRTVGSAGVMQHSAEEFGQAGASVGAPSISTPSAPPAGVSGERPETGLARLVLTLVELLRQVLEHQALRRMEGQSLSEEQVERMGVALMELEAKLAEIREQFGLSEADLNVDLGPLGRLLS